MDLTKISATKIRTDLWRARILCEERCLYKACEFIDDLIFSLPEESEEKLVQKLYQSFVSTAYDAKHEQAVACFQLNEYDRAAHFLKDATNPKSLFLHFFSLYKAAEKKRIDLLNDDDFSRQLPPKVVRKFNDLRDSIERYMAKNKPDGWVLYVYGLVLYKFRLNSTAEKVFQLSVNEDPSNWSAWHMLTLVVNDLSNLKLPNHIFKVFFHFAMRLELNLSDEAPWTLTNMKETKQFIDKYFKRSLFIKTIKARAIGYTNQPASNDRAIQMFEDIRALDPYRLEGLEVYSNLLYVDGRRTELSKLAREIEKVDLFTPESNCCVANSYSARDQHSRAITYFNRALRLNPDHNTAWTLLGHEYLEVESTSKAEQAYRESVSINKRDCRAWLGLGNVFETINSNPATTTPNFEACLYYFSQVKKYRPNDHIMWMAMTNIYEKMNCIGEAIKCSIKAGKVGLPRLAKLYEMEGKHDEAKKIVHKLTQLQQ